GTIIYGVKEYLAPDKKHLPEKLDGIDRTQFSKEWLEQVINGNIEPPDEEQIHRMGMQLGELFSIDWILYADDMPPKQGKIPFLRFFYSLR
ncbi:MAG: hypothetical protein HY731_10470, partial [Candidatus Tectomicrobia bacterium]|nr:hypothetical protein [Candidatus Tectomicrobia bacterium]